MLERINTALSHRSPDGQGIHIEGNVGLGHRRLAIIDLSPAAARPMPSEEKTLWITSTGEIYNFQELRRDLEARGRRFRSHADAEVILLPAGAERSPNAVLEALASALPVVATDVAGKRELVGQDGRAGWLVPPEAPARLAEAVGTLAAAPALRLEIRTAGRAAVLERFVMERVGGQYLSLYGDLEE